MVAVVVLAGCTGGSDEAEDIEIEDGRGLERDVQQTRAVVRARVAVGQQRYPGLIRLMTYLECGRKVDHVPPPRS